ncbi:M20 family metallopeptidase [Micromonospora soli]|uniref:M20 family metallopeptidase n=1 Tax=Micromonospora sp. NBRC 110009 TaxID=3061627 RepID=UPI0026732D04|nr:M20 family metallopeptidase [Micromonospora sp. NBRC 110009]WKT97481.1 M20 family metallopeptidase [Micromonospora sp. NBRC 110009]
MSVAAAKQLDPRPLDDFLRAHRDDMLADLAAYVRLETPSDDLEALARGRDWVSAWVQQRLGPAAVARTEPGGDHGDTLVLDYAGTQQAAAAAPVAVLAHYDTVWPLGTIEDIPFTVTGDIIRGPGVFDMKAGLVQAVWALRALDALGLPRPPVRLILNGDEELGSPASRPVIEEACQGAAAVLVFEASAAGAVKTARKGVGLFDLTLTGVEAHAGLDPTAGASAITALAEFVLHATALTDLQAGTTVNVGVVDGGTRRNVTAGSAHAGIDVRVATTEEADRVERELREWRPSNPLVRARVDGGWNRPVMARTPAIADLFTRAQGLARQLGFELREIAVGGASDGNFAAALGLPVLDGVGAVGSGAHARDEHATVSGLLERGALAAALVTSLADPPDRG